jgi:blue copper oxidase
VTCDPGERVVLRSFPPDLGANFFEGRFAGADDTFDLLQIRAGTHLAASPEVPDHLSFRGCLLRLRSRQDGGRR